MKMTYTRSKSKYHENNINCMNDHETFFNSLINIHIKMSLKKIRKCHDQLKLFSWLIFLVWTSYSPFWKIIGIEFSSGLSFSFVYKRYFCYFDRVIFYRIERFKLRSVWTIEKVLLWIFQVRLYWISESFCNMKLWK